MTHDTAERKKRSGLVASPLAARLFLYAMLVGAGLTAIVATVNVIQDYRARYEELQTVLASIEESYVPAIAQSVFGFNDKQLALLLEGIVLLRDVSYAEVVELRPGGAAVLASHGEPLTGDYISRTYPLQVVFRGEDRQLGRLEVHASDGQIRRLVRGRLGVLALSSGLQTFAVALLLWLILEHSVIRHLRDVAAHVRSLRVPADGARALDLSRKERQDELADIAAAINDANARLVESHDRLSAALEEKNTLLQELYHRTKNNMQTVAAMLDMRAARTPNNEQIKDLVRDTRARIQAMAMVHEKLYQSRDLSRIPFGDYLRDLVVATSHSYGAADVGTDVEADDSRILLDTAIPLGLVVAELLSNSMIHAFPDGRGGEIRIRFRAPDGGSIGLFYSDNGIGLPAGFDPNRDGSVGMNTITSLVERQLGGTIRFEKNQGFGCEIRLNASRYAERI